MNSMPTALAIPDTTRREIEAEANDTTAAMALVEGLTITNAADLDFAGELVKLAKARWKELEEKRTSVTKPLNEVLRQVNGWFRPAQEPLVRAEAVLKGKISAYTLEQRAASEAAMRAAAAAMQAGDTEAAAEHVTAIAPAAKTAGVSVQERWAFEIVDPDAVPRTFCSPDEAKIRRVLTNPVHGLIPKVEGVRFYLDGKVVVRT